MTTEKSQKSAARTPKPQSRSEADAPAAARAHSKAAAIIALLRRDGGATLEEMMATTGWQKHSVRGFMAGALKKRHGLTVTSVKTGQGRSYRVESEAQA